jgi:YfiH family protein
MNLVDTNHGLNILVPNWQVPEHVQAFVSTRKGGVSQAPYDSLNVGKHVGDHIFDVEKNRELLQQILPSQPLWLNQVHGTQIWTSFESSLEADGAVTEQPNQVLTIMTADCMPILFCDEQGDILAACHAGWRGLAQGVIQKTLEQMIRKKQPTDTKRYISEINVYLGPTIGPSHFEVGEDVYDAFSTILHSQQLDSYFVTTSQTGKYFANLFAIAQFQLNHLGIERVFSEEICCFEHSDLFYSHRRDKKTGRFASFLWKSE